MKQISRIPMPKCDFNEVTNLFKSHFRHRCSPVNTLHISRITFPKSTSLDSCIWNINFVSTKLCINFYWSSRPKKFFKKVVLRNLTKFTGKHLCQSLFFNKVAGFSLQLYLKEALAQLFSCEFCEIFKNPFFKEHLRWLLLYIY